MNILRSIFRFLSRSKDVVSDEDCVTKTLNEHGYETIVPVIDDAFFEFCLSSLSDNLDISAITDKHLLVFEDASFEYLRNHPDTETTRKYFKNLRIIWVLLIKRGRLRDAEWFLNKILISTYQFERRFGVLIHKGPIYYFWGGTSLMLGQLDKGFLLMHKAYAEEIRIKEPQPTPSYKFVSLDYSDNNQFFGPWVKMYADYLIEFFIPYRMEKITHYRLDDFQTGFLESNPNPDIVFSFTHTLARLSQLSLFSNDYLNSDFAGQYKLNLLFDLVLVIENALRIKHPKYGKDKLLLFRDLAENLASLVSWNLTSGNLTNTVQKEAKKDYDNCLDKLLDRQLPFTNPIVNRNLESDLAIAYLIRNRGAHHLAASKVVNRRFEQLLQSLFNTLFLTAEVMY